MKTDDLATARARIEALEAVLRMLADDRPGAGYKRLMSGNWYCGYCGVDLTGHLKDHAPDCPIACARKLLE